MSNPLFNMVQQRGPMSQLLQNFQQFKQAFQGNPQQKVQELLNSGRVSQAQYNQAVQMAQQLQRIIGVK